LHAFYTVGVWIRNYTFNQPRVNEITMNYKPCKTFEVHGQNENPSLEYKSSNIDIANEWLASVFVKRIHKMT
jgi:hypothetical protein